jgi:hypothetical protein
MVNQPEIPHLFENDFRRFARAARPRPFAIDPWVASSLLQKAIRRGEVRSGRESCVHAVWVSGPGHMATPNRHRF